MADPHPILLVDDDPNDVFLFKRAATKSRLANPIHTAADGEEAVEYLKKLQDEGGTDSGNAPVVVILDLKMPRKTGFEVLEWLRDQPGLRRLPVVVFTSSAQDPDVNRAYDLGANSHLVKPVTFEDLLEMMKTLGLYWAIHNTGPDLTSPTEI